jgi:hypothetical protein
MHELYDRRTPLLFGAERGIDWSTSHGYHKQRRTPEENYLRVRLLKHAFQPISKTCCAPKSR